MSYFVQANLADDGDLRRRITACAASAGVDSPESFASERRWEFSTQPGWVDAYKQAVDDGVLSPGVDETVITDVMIRDAVVKLGGVA